ncbi:MAG: ABC transporter ATP-binding protein [Oscillospiraceae bacterium]|nr:ABC transporter ATP-binding protein [Oscillospiraceae bacterium]
MISLSHICKEYRVATRSEGMKAALKSFFKREYISVEALKDISFDIKRGEIVGYIGPNGAGKSTTVKILCGVLVPTSGNCSVLGLVPWENRLKHVSHIGVVFGQRSQLLWDIPVIDSFSLLKDIYRVDELSYKENLEELSYVFGLEEYLSIPVRQLSLGQRMRCEIAASMLHNPQILFLDEPTIGLDAVSQIAVRNYIRRINKEKDVTVLLTTHDMGDVEALAERVMLIGKGQILYDGSFSSMKSRYDTVNLITIEYDPTMHLKQPEHTALVSNENGRAILSVDTSKTAASSVIGQLSSSLWVKDISVQSRPIEEIIAEIYEEYEI